MRTLTIRQPWAGLIALGVKDVERRTWAPPDDMIGDRFAVHAGKWDDDPRRTHVIAALDDDALADRLVDIHGFIVCTVRLVDAHFDSGLWQWQLSDARRVRNSPFLRGRPGIWHS